MARINSRKKGNNYELVISGILDEWWSGLKRPAKERDFRRTPLSGGWDTVKAPGDLLIPSEFPYDIECKNRESWSFENFFTGSNALVNWIILEELKTNKEVWLVFTKKRALNYIMMRKRLWSRIGATIAEGSNSFTSYMNVGVTINGGINSFVVFLLDEFLELVDSEIFRNG